VKIRYYAKFKDTMPDLNLDECIFSTKPCGGAAIFTEKDQF
jgi:hypothetical protein